MDVKARTAISLVKRLMHPGNPAALGDIIAEVRLLTKHDADIRVLLADAGAVSLLSRHLLADPPISTASSLENASAALLNISISAREPLMSTPGFLDALTHSISPAAASPEVAQNIAAVVFSLLSVDAYRPIIGSKKTLISALIALIPDPDSRTVKDVLRALFGVGLYALNLATMVELGVVRPLFSLVTEDSRQGVAEDALAVVAKVAGCWESLEEFRNESGIGILVNLVDRRTGASRRVRENAVTALLNLAMSGGDSAVAEIREFVGVEGFVKELVEDKISARATNKAVALLNALERRRRNPVESHWIRDFDLLDISTPPASASSSEWTSY